ncbi:MAG: CooT family nickel-binding protein [Chloroflexota bacterium]|nr:CooT family nickel-binding protein [Chloroflexota bacterium]
MCLATAYIENEGEQEEVMQDVAWIELGSDGLRLGAFLGESKLLQARIKRIDLVHNSIILKEMADDPA